MNYIKKLQQENKQMLNTLSDIETLIYELRSYLLSPKFTNEGELQNYVNTKDVLSYLSSMRTMIIEGTNSESKDDY